VISQVQRSVGPGALLRLVGGALRFDGATFRAAVSPSAPTRLHLAIVALAAVSNGYAYAMEAVASGMIGENDFALYRLLLLVGAAETVVQFLLFVGVIYLIRLIARRPPVGFAALCRLLALGVAPICLMFLGPAFGVQDWLRGGLIAWRIVISVVGLKIATESSWIGAVLTVVAADFVSSPIVSLLMFGIAKPSSGGALGV
jgi:hypothetical protein